MHSSGCHMPFICSPLCYLSYPWLSMLKPNWWNQSISSHQNTRLGWWMLESPRALRFQPTSLVSEGPVCRSFTDPLALRAEVVPFAFEYYISHLIITCHRSLDSKMRMEYSSSGSVTLGIIAPIESGCTLNKKCSIFTSVSRLQSGPCKF